jgi:hypothetical protein
VPPSPTGDFRDLPLWRRQAARLAVALVEECRRPLLVPMTLVTPSCVTEIFGAFAAAGVPVHHFFLAVPATVAARNRLPGDTVVPDGERPPGGTGRRDPRPPGDGRRAAGGRNPSGMKRTPRGEEKGGDCCQV